MASKKPSPVQVLQQSKKAVAAFVEMGSRTVRDPKLQESRFAFNTEMNKLKDLVEGSSG